jgi:serine/threonine protein phosphatase PrpC|mmetsp:Transcript_3495/g.4651  ORF Transcript_3495/g.4651 Transcript_3495/m.4651 type:complete len:173 (+) Transcript_3495:76-594(+)
MHNLFQRRAFAEGRATSQQARFPFFNAAVFNNPKYDKRYKGGEDAFVITESKRMVGVADGVGGHESREVCSGVCSRFLCKFMGQLYESDPAKSLKEILMAGHKALADAKIDGSTTVVLASLEDTKESDSVKMNTLNLGDSAYLLLRPEGGDSPQVTKLFRSVEALHYFNCPF